MTHKFMPALPETGKEADVHWKKIDRRNSACAEKLLREHELWCVAACGRFLKRRSSKDTAWILLGRNNDIHALIVYSNRTLLPVFCGSMDIPEPKFLKKFFGMLPIHSIQGLVNEVIFIEQYLSKNGLEAIDKIDYDLMYIDNMSNNAAVNSGPAGLTLREAQRPDLDELAALQAGYEQEEVLPQGAVFYPTVSRLNMEKIFANEQLLVAELGGHLVGKINTSAETFTRNQIGGVYVLPAYRNMGIARRMTAEFVRMLLGQGRGVSLFVKKSNPAAKAVYQRLGFKFLADYRISYF